MTKKKDNNYYVYIHRKKTNGDVFYVGKGKQYRAFDFNRRSMLWNKIKNKHGVIVEIVHNNLQEWYSFELECELILKYGRIDKRTGKLANHTDGGDGASGTILSVEQRKQISERQVGELNPVYDKVLHEYENLFTGELMVCTQYEFTKQTGHQHGLTRRSNAGGWYKPGSLSESVKEQVRNRYRGVYSNLQNTEVHSFINLSTGLVEDMSVSTFIRVVGYSPSRLLKDDNCKSMVGYSTPSKVEKYGILNLRSGLKDYTVYSLTNVITNDVVEGNRRELVHSLGVDIVTMLHADGISKGWRLSDSKKTVPEGYIVYEFKNETGDIFKGTRSEFKAKFGFNVHNLFKKSTINTDRVCKGWSLLK